MQQAVYQQLPHNRVPVPSSFASQPFSHVYIYYYVSKQSLFSMFCMIRRFIHGKGQDIRRCVFVTVHPVQVFYFFIICKQDADFGIMDAQESQEILSIFPESFHVCFYQSLLISYLYCHCLYLQIILVYYRS